MLDLTVFFLIVNDSPSDNRRKNYFTIDQFLFGSHETANELQVLNNILGVGCYCECERYLDSTFGKVIQFHAVARDLLVMSSVREKCSDPTCQVFESVGITSSVYVVILVGSYLVPEF